jgi:hypothetical protein
VSLLATTEHHVSTHTMDADRRLLLAWAIGEWSAAHTHLTALAKSGDPIAGREAKRTRRELVHLTHRWRIGQSVTVDIPATEEVIAQAREHCTTYVERLDALLKERLK